MNLFAKLSNPELFLKSLNENGATFYHVVEETIGVCTVEAVYFSSNRTIYFRGEMTIYFRGEMTPSQLETLKAQSYKAESITIDETEDSGGEVLKDVLETMEAGPAKNKIVLKIIVKR